MSTLIIDNEELSGSNLVDLLSRDDIGGAPMSYVRWVSLWGLIGDIG